MTRIPAHAMASALCFLPTMVLPACTQNNEAPAPMAPAPHTPEAAKAHNDKAVATGEQAAPYVYSFAGKRDPFHSYLAEVHEREEEAQRGHVREPTEEFETNQFRLTAIVSGNPSPSAMVEDPSGRGHILRIGSRIGKNNGRITNIDATGLSIIEQFFDGTGKLLEVSSVLRLPISDDSISGRP